MTFFKRVLIGLTLTTLVTVPVLAKVSASAVRPGNFTWEGTQTIPLTPGGALFLSWSGQGRFMINYSAECETHGDWVSLQIVVDGVVLEPTVGTDDAFCSDHNNNNLLDGWTTAHYSVATTNLPLGVHTVRILGSVIGPAGSDGWLGDSSLVVTK